MSQEKVEIELREGQVWLIGTHARRIVGIVHDTMKPRAHVIYSVGGNGLRSCSLRRFKRLAKNADDITNAEIQVEGELV